MDQAQQGGLAVPRPAEKPVRGALQGRAQSEIQIALAAQLSLFGGGPTGPEGLKYQPAFITDADEDTLIGHIRALPLAPFQFGQYEGKRRVVFFGSLAASSGSSWPQERPEANRYQEFQELKPTRSG